MKKLLLLLVLAVGLHFGYNSGMLRHPPCQHPSGPVTVIGPDGQVHIFVQTGPNMWLQVN